MEVLQVSKPLPWLMLIEARAGGDGEAGTTGSDAPRSSTARQIPIRRRPGAQASAVPAIGESIWRPPRKAGRCTSSWTPFLLQVIFASHGQEMTKKALCRLFYDNCSPSNRAYR